MILDHNYGFELTFHWNNQFRNVLGIKRYVDKREGSVVNQVRITQAVIDLYNQKWTKPSFDQLEIHSEPLGDLNSITKFYNLNRSIADCLGLKIRTKKISSGGGHLHLSPKGKPWEPSDVNRIFRNAAVRPYLSWAFCDPEDNLSTRCPYRISKQNRHFKNYSIVNRHKTLEFRFFEAPRDLSEQLLHVQFAERFAKMPFKRPRYSLNSYKKEIEFHDCLIFLDWTIDRALTEFERLCKILNLSFADYEAIATRNITMRFSYGEDYLT